MSRERRERDFYHPDCGMSPTCWAGENRRPGWERLHETCPGDYLAQIGDLRECRCECHGRADQHTDRPE